MGAVVTQMNTAGVMSIVRIIPVLLLMVNSTSTEVINAPVSSRSGFTMKKAFVSGVVVIQVTICA